MIGGTTIVDGSEASLGNVISANLQSGVKIDGAAFGNQLVGNMIGADREGKLPLGNGILGLDDEGDGVAIVGAVANVIGGRTEAQRNFIVNNVKNGVHISGTGATLNVVIGNYIGIGPDGKTPQANRGNGVLIEDSAANTIGAHNFGQTRNVLSGNTGAGVRIQGANARLNQVLGNWIGTDAQGNAPVANDTGVLITEGASVNFIEDDVMSGNLDSGVAILESPLNIVRSCFIGTNGAGLAAVKNRIGIQIQGSPGTVIGGNSFAEGGNRVSGNGQTGIVVIGVQSTGTRIQGNQIGVITKDGNDEGLGNGNVGVNIQDAAGVVVSDNIIGGNLRGGIRLKGASDTHFTNNLIGVGHNGAELVAIPNKSGGVFVIDSSNNFIGESVGNSIQGNLITHTESVSEDDPGEGIVVLGNSKGNRIQGNTISDNSGDGVVIFASEGNTVGGSAEQGNIIFQNENGIRITGSDSKQNAVLGNWIGLRADGSAAGNRANGVVLTDGSSQNLIGKNDNASRNRISANAKNGIFISSGANKNTVMGNYVGTNVAGAFQDGFGNHQFGIRIDNSAENRIGGFATVFGEGSGNRIVGNGAGIAIEGAQSTKNSVEGNEIAKNQSIDDPVAAGDGILISSGASNNEIGGFNVLHGNRIHDNSAAGVSISSGVQNEISHNLIFANKGLGIDLAPPDGLNTLQPPKVVGVGANHVQNAPSLSFATAGASPLVTGTLQGAASTQFIVEFFAGDIDFTDGTKHVDAKEFLFSDPVETNKSGLAFFNFDLPGDVAVKKIIRATATDLAGNTSEFSPTAVVEPDKDGDGVPDRIENDAPRGGDANHDDKPDREQPNVASVQDAKNSNAFVTLVAPAGVSFQKVRTLENPSPDDAPVQTQFGLGFFDFTLTGVEPGAHVPVTLILPVTAAAPNVYWRYGPTKTNPVDHWFDWNYDRLTDTGAEFNGNTITLHFVDGARGDEDLAANGIIVDAGGPGFPDPFTVTTTADSGPGSLRQVLLDANANPGTDLITFNIPEPGTHTIQPLSALPAITDSVTIDGLTLPPSEDGFDRQATTPLIKLDGSLAGPGVDGLLLNAGGSTIQGLAINRFTGDGIHIAFDGGSDVFFNPVPGENISGNYIGTDLTGTIARGNGAYGVEIDNSPANSITGGNVISGNAAGGIFLHGGSAIFNDIKNNLIGTQADGASPLGNGGPGVRFDADATSVLVLNTIAFNAGAGVEAQTTTTEIFVSSNSIFSNGGLGIDLLGDGVTPNDADESDGLLNFPILTDVTSYGGRTHLTGFLISYTEEGFSLRFYASAQADPSGFGEGQTFLAQIPVFTDQDGRATFDFTINRAVAPGSFVTATAGDLSEFSPAFQVPVPEVLTYLVNTADDVNDAVPDPARFSLREAILAANSHPGPDLINFNLPNQNRTISPLAPLPEITDAVIIDGTTQFGFKGLPLVELDGSLAGAGANGLRITAGGSVVRGLVINRFQSNPFSGSGGSGIELTGRGGNRLEGTFLGTDVTGTRALRNEIADVLVKDSPDNVIGGTTAVARNVILFVRLAGFNVTGNRVEGNYIGTDVTGTAFLADTSINFGINIEQGVGNTIGGTDAGAGNLIAGGVRIFLASSNVAQGNLIGTDVTGTRFLSRGNTGSTPGGVEISAGNLNLIGGTSIAARNIIPGGVIVAGSGNQIQGNYIGTDITGTAVVHVIFAFGVGVNVGGNFNLIGGTEPGAGNLISGHRFAGVNLVGSNNSLQGNYIGTDATGTKALGNFTGVRGIGFSNHIGGPFPGAGNVISGNETYGVSMRGFGQNTIQGNFIGTDPTGTRAVAGKFPGSGILVDENNDIIGGSTPGAGNVISGNDGDGIDIGVGVSVSGTGILGNFIGTDVTGSVPLGNSRHGIYIQRSKGSFIAGNLISANGGDGISILDGEANNPSSGTVIQGNKIGADVTGAKDFGNAGDGIGIVTSAYVVANETIGGTDPDTGNLIAFNHGRGGSALFGSRNSIRGNNIFANGGLGIVNDINGVLSTYTDNRGVQLPHPAPVLTSAVFDPAGTEIEGSLTGTPFTRYEIDLFANDGFDASGFGEGQTYLESLSVFVDDTGAAFFRIPLDPAVPVGQWITATATDPDGNTSQFSRAMEVVAFLNPNGPPSGPVVPEDTGAGEVGFSTGAITILTASRPRPRSVLRQS